MKNTLQMIETTEEGVKLSFETYGIFISYEVAEPTWDKAKEIAAGMGHVLPSVEQAFPIIENTDKINQALKEAGKPAFNDWFWLDREHSTFSGCAWAVYMSYGYIDWDNKNDLIAVRVVTAFQL